MTGEPPRDPLAAPTGDSDGDAAGELDIFSAPAPIGERINVRTSAPPPVAESGRTSALPPLADSTRSGRTSALPPLADSTRSGRTSALPPIADSALIGRSSAPPPEHPSSAPQPHHPQTSPAPPRLGTPTGAPRTEEGGDERLAVSSSMPDIPDLDLDPRIAGPQTERSTHFASLPASLSNPSSRRPWQSLAAEVGRAEAAPAARRRSRRIVKPQDDSAPSSGDRLAAPEEDAPPSVPEPRAAVPPDGRGGEEAEEWPVDSSPHPDLLEYQAPKPSNKLIAPPNLSELFPPRSVPRPAVAAVPRPAPKPSSLPPPPTSPVSGLLVDPDSVAVIRPIQILSIESNLPPVSSLTEPAAPPAAEAVGKDVTEWASLAFRITADGPQEAPGALPDAPQDGVADGPPTTRDGAIEAVRAEAFAAHEVPELDAEPVSNEERQTSNVTIPPLSGDVDLVELESPDRGTIPPRSSDVEVLEVDPERDSTEIADEIPAEMADEIPAEMIERPTSHPKKPPPPPRRPRAQQLASHDLGSYSNSGPISVLPPPPASASQLDPSPSVRSPGSEPPPAVVAPAVAAAPPPQKTPDPEPSSAPATEPTPRRKHPWWEELFGDDFLRTLDKVDAKVVRREVDFIEERLGVEKGAVILDLACGAGMHAIEIASRGYSVVGYDLSLAMLSRAADEAQDRGQKLNFLQGDMREMNFEETFDGIYCWSTSFGYFDDEKNLDVLARIRRALRSGGMLLLDIVNRDYVSCRQPSLVWFEGDGCICMDEMQVDFFTSRLKVKRTVMFEDGRSRELDYSLRLYNLHELGKMLHEAGFKVTEVTGHPAHPGVFFGSESPRLIVLAERG